MLHPKTDIVPDMTACREWALHHRSGCEAGCIDPDAILETSALSELIATARVFCDQYYKNMASGWDMSWSHEQCDAILTATSILSHFVQPCALDGIISELVTTYDLGYVRHEHLFRLPVPLDGIFERFFREWDHLTDVLMEHDSGWLRCHETTLDSDDEAMFVMEIEV